MVVLPNCQPLLDITFLKWPCYISGVASEVVSNDTFPGSESAYLAPRNEIGGFNDMSTTITAALAANENAVVAAPVQERTPGQQDAALSEERHHFKRQQQIEIAAYYIAERRAFEGDFSHDDWLQAEREVDGMIAVGKLAD